MVVIILNCVTIIAVDRDAVIGVVVVVVIAIVIGGVAVVVYDYVVSVAYVLFGCVVHDIVVRSVLSVDGYIDIRIVCCVYC